MSESNEQLFAQLFGELFRELWEKWFVLRRKTVHTRHRVREKY